MKNQYYVILSFILLGINLQAQISTNELPVSFLLDNSTFLFKNRTVEVLPHLDMEAIDQEDLENDAKSRPLRFGYKHKVDFNLNNSGKWTNLSNGDKIWQLEISCPNALSINLLYDKFWLPEGAKFFIFSSDKKHTIGAFTSVNNKGGRENPLGFATGLVFGDAITLEYYLPASVQDSSIISISYVVHGYRFIFSDETNSKSRDVSCLVNVNCSEGDAWKNEKNAVALIVVDGYA